MSKSIKFIKNVVLTTEYDGEKEDIAFCFGSIYPVDSVKQGEGDACDIVISDGTIIRGVSRSVFRPMGSLQIERVAEEVAEVEFVELEVEEKKEAPISLGGEIVVDEKPVKPAPKKKK
jgi:hypothetical protein